MSGTRQVFPEAFKREALERVAMSGLSVGSVARELGLHETVLRRWMMQVGAQATGAARRRPTTQAPAPSPSGISRTRKTVNEVSRHSGSPEARKPRVPWTSEGEAPSRA